MKYLVIVLLFLVACGADPPGTVGDGLRTTLAVAPTIRPTVAPPVSCAIKAASFMQESTDLFTEWRDAYELASSAPRVGLVNQIAELQRIRRDTSALDAPECAALAKSHLVSSMDNSIDGFIAFLGQKSDSTVAGYFDTATEEIKAYRQQVDLLTGEVIRSYTSPGQSYVTLRIGGSAQNITLTYTLRSGEDTTTISVGAPWEDVSWRASGQQITFMAKNDGTGIVACEVLVDKNVVRHEESGTVADCSMPVP